jgi:23S rRNA pseudouridine1911/1915/1917 synthase
MFPSMRIVFEDEHLIALDKPAGIPSTSLRPAEEGTVAAWLLKRHPLQAKLPDGQREAGLVNRLDNDTSGIILAAKTDESLSNLRAQFAGGTVRKEYEALVVGIPPDESSIDAPIAHHPRKKHRMVACESQARTEEWKGRSASTAFGVIERFTYKQGNAMYPYALLRVSISTGVRHQIRVHLAHMGFPIAGDTLYRNPRKRASDPLNPKRHFLHASKLEIAHPVSGKRLAFEAERPPDLKELLALLQKA